MTEPHFPLPGHYASSIRTIIRYAIVMVVVGLLSGVLFQESAKKLSYAEAAPGLHIEATIRLALVHGHIFIVAVLIPLAMAGALVLARRSGGREVSARCLCWLTRGYLPFAGVTLALMLYKAYHVLLAVRGGDSDLDAVLGGLFGGQAMLRHSVYGLAHVGLAACLGVFVIGLWRSLSRVPSN